MSIQQSKITIGLFGFGVVGTGLYQVLQQTPSLQTKIKKVCIKHPEKPRAAPKELFTTDADEILNDPEINVIVELIDDSEAAFNITSRALGSKKAVVSANKKMIAHHFQELLALQEANDVPFLYESACCASIPVIRNLEEYYDNDLLQSIYGIVNGSTNYILSLIEKEKLSFDEALKLAQQKGFAESDPTLDIEGYDAVNKLCILLVHAYGIIEQPSQLLFHGIQNLQNRDFKYAAEKQLYIKLVASAQKLKNGNIAAFVLPQFVEKQHSFANVIDEYNGVIIESSLADKQFFSGKGAGSYPTASAVLSDISALRYQYKYEYRKSAYQELQEEKSQLSDEYYLNVYCSFNKLHQIPHHLFHQIEEWSSTPNGCYVKGIIHASQLRNTWWRQEHVSLILYPNPIIESDTIDNSKQNSNNLAFAEI